MLDDRVPRSVPANEDDDGPSSGSGLGLGLGVEGGKSIGLGHGAKTYGGDEDALTGAVSADSHRTTHCESQTTTSC